MSDTTSTGASKAEERRRQFVEERAGATTSASWTSELLLPVSANEGGEVNEEENLGLEGSDSLVSEKKQKNSKNNSKTKPTKEEAKATKKTAKKNSKRSTHDTEEREDEEEDEEARLLRQQQALGEMSEIDFLNQLGGASTSSSPSSGGGGAGGSSSTAGQEEIEDATTSEDQDQKKKNKKKSNSKTKENDVVKPKPLSPAAQAEAEAQRQERLAMETRRVRLFNFPYVATENQLKQFVTSQIGPIEDIHLPLTRDTRQSKGAAFVRFVNPSDAVACLQKLHGSIFMGRLVRVTAAEEDPYQQQLAVAATSGGQAEQDGEGNGSSSGAPPEDGGTRPPGALPGSSAFKRERDAQRRAEEEAAMRHLSEGGGPDSGIAVPQRWNALYMNSSAAVERVAQRMQLRSEDLVRVDTKGAATRAAIAEALLTSETQQVLGDEGIALDVLSSSTQNLLRPRSATTILVKNLGLHSADEAKALSALFAKYGVLEVTAFPQSGLFALFRFSQAQDARVAFRRLSFKLFQGTPLYLEWAPVGSVVEKEEDWEEEAEPQEQGADKAAATNDDNNNENKNRTAVMATQVFTLFLTNIPFQLQDEDELYAFLLDACPRFAGQPEKHIKRLVFEKEKGRAFITLDSDRSLQYAQRQWHGKKLRDRVLSCVPSKANAPAAALSNRLGSSSAVGSTGTGAAPAADEDDEEPPMRLVHPTSSSGGAKNSNVPPGCDPLKLVVKNVPFEATEQDVRSLFSAFSEVRSVRLPRKAQQFSHHRENHHRGFAFVEFLSESEAARALQTLRATHLYGRHLVLQYAKLEQQ